MAAIASPITSRTPSRHLSSCCQRQQAWSSSQVSSSALQSHRTRNSQQSCTRAIAVVPGTVSKRTKQYQLEILQTTAKPKPQSLVRQVSDAGLTRRQRFQQDEDGGLPSRQIVLIATDVDGTLLNSNHALSERTERSLLMAQEQGIQVVLATGKARGPWFPEIKERLKLETPGVFLQGLMVYSADGTLLYERAMAEDVARQVIRFGKAEGVTLTAYCGERILCEERDEHTDRLIPYGEPIPEAVGPLEDLIGITSIHKLILMADDDTLAALRPRLDAELGGRGSLITSVPGMLEVLPVGASKATGLATVLDMMGLHPQQVMAAGDGENDIEMLQMVGLGVAMANAGPSVKAVADHVSSSNDHDGLAAAVERFALTAGLWCWD